MKSLCQIYLIVEKKVCKKKGDGQIIVYFKDHFFSKYEKLPKVIQGLDGIYSLKRLSEAI